MPFGSSGGSQVNVNDVEVVLSILTFRGGPPGTEKKKAESPRTHRLSEVHKISLLTIQISKLV